MVVLLGACGPTYLSKGPSVTTVVQVENASLPYRTLTDLENILDVDSNGEMIFVATDLGIRVYPKAGGSAKSLDWLPHGYSQAVTSSRDEIWAAYGTVVYHGNGLRSNQGDGSLPKGKWTFTQPVRDLALDTKGKLLVCTDDGLLRQRFVERDAKEWVRAELSLSQTEPSGCARLVPSEGGVWVIGKEGGALIELNGDVAHDHHRALRELSKTKTLRILDVQPLGNGDVLTLIAIAERAQLALYRDGRWFSYTSLPFDGAVLGLAGAPSKNRAWLVTDGGHFLVDVAPEAEGVSAVAVAVGESDRILRWKPAWSAVNMGEPIAPTLRALAEAPVQRAIRFSDPPLDSPDAPELRFVLLDLPVSKEATVFGSETDVFLAPPHQGLTRLRADGSATHYATKSLLPSPDQPYRLSFARDESGTYFVAANGLLARSAQRGLGFVAPIGVQDSLIDAVASNGSSLIAAARDLRNPTSILLYSYKGDAFTPSRSVEVGAPVQGVASLGFGSGGDIWLAPRVSVEGKTQGRGVIWLPPASEDPVAFHRGVELVEGAQSKPAPNEVFDLDLGQGGFAWLATFSGAVRIGDDQVVVFGQARGVPGDSVYDISASDERIWMVAAGALGSYDNRDIDFGVPSWIKEIKPSRIAAHERTAWVVGDGGVARFDGEQWHRLELPDDLAGPVIDVDIDAEGNVWLLFADRLVQLDRGQL